MHLEDVRAGKDFRRRAIAMRFFKLGAIGPGAKRSFILPVSENDVIITFNRPENFQAYEAGHVLDQPRPPFEAFFELRLMTFGDLNSIGNDNHVLSLNLLTKLLNYLMQLVPCSASLFTTKSTKVSIIKL